MSVSVSVSVYVQSSSRLKKTLTSQVGRKRIPGTSLETGKNSIL